MALQASPPEIILSIAEILVSERDLSSFTRTCTYFNRLLSGYLYKNNATRHHSFALFWAAENGQNGTVRRMLDQGAKVNGIYGYDDDHEDFLPYYPKAIPLYVAAENGRLETAQLLLDEGAKSDTVVWNALKRAAVKGHASMVELLLNHGADVNFEGDRGGLLINCASCSGSAALVRLLLENGAVVNSRTPQTYAPLIYAASNRDSDEMMRVLLEYGADVDSVGAENRTALWYAVTMNFFNVTFALAPPENRPEPGILINSLVTSEVALRGSERKVKLLLDNGADVNAKESDGRSALWWAITTFWWAMHTNRPELAPRETIRLLLDHNADVNSKDTDGRSLLSWASGLSCHQMYDLLLENGAEVDSRDNSGRSVASWAGQDLKDLKYG